MTSSTGASRAETLLLYVQVHIQYNSGLLLALVSATD